MRDGRGSRDLERLLTDSLEAAGSAYDPADPASARERFHLRRHRRGVAFALGSVAVTAAAALIALGVARLDLFESPSRPAAVEDRFLPAQIVGAQFLYSDDEDIYALQGRRSRPVVDSKASETSPTLSPQGDLLAFERTTGDGSSKVVVLEVASEDLEVVAEGRAPSFGPGARLAWVDSSAGTDAIAVRGAGGVMRLDPGLEAGSSIRSLAWGAAGTAIYFASTSPGGLYEISVEPGATASRLEFPAEDPGARFVAPAVSADGSVAVLRIVPQGGSVSSLDLGIVTPSGASTTFDKIEGLDDFLLDSNEAALFLAPAGGLDYEIDAGWTVGSSRSWFVGDGNQLWLVDEERESDRIDLGRVTGTATVP